MAKREEWSEIRAELEARGYDLDVSGLDGSPAQDDAWAVWDRIEIDTPVKGDPDWASVQPRLAEIERALALPLRGSQERRTLDHMRGTTAVRRAVKGLSAGALQARSDEESLRRFSLAARAARQAASSPTLIGVLLGASALRTVFDAAERLLERGLSVSANAHLRTLVTELALTSWRKTVLGELRFGMSWIDRAASGREDWEDDFDESSSQIVRLLKRSGEADRAKAILARRFAQVLDAPRGASEDDDLALFARLASRLDLPKTAALSPDPLIRLSAKASSRTWPELPRLYASVLGERRLTLLASRAADLPSGASFAEVLRLRESLGIEGREPLSRRPLEVRDEGAHWTFRAAAGGHVSSVRLPRP